MSYHTTTKQKIHCFFSGGRDSSLACWIAKRVADVRHWDFSLIYIDTTIAIKQTQEYVRKYAEWLNAELVVIRPERTFREYATQYAMWPSLHPYRYRWCMRRLKLEPSVEYLRQNYRRGDLVVLGIRRAESRFRERLYNEVFTDHVYGSRVKVRLWLPLLYVDEITLIKLVNMLIRDHNMPTNPVWRIGFSGECLCLAGASLHKIVLIAKFFPDEFQQLLEIDDLINTRRRKSPSAPFTVTQAGFRTLREFAEKVQKITLLDNFLNVDMTYKSCERSCML